MTITKHGHRPPVLEEDLWNTRGVYNEETGMMGNLYTDAWPAAKASRFFMTTEHEAVGQETWFEAPDLDEAMHFLDNLKAVQVAKECTHLSTHADGQDTDGSQIEECDACGERWNEGQ